MKAGLPLFCCLLACCSQSSKGTTPFQERADTGGVIVLRFDPGRIPTSLHWTAAAVPIVTVGSNDMLPLMSVVGGFFLEAGTFVVADDAGIYLLDSRGEQVERFGRRGEGVGEFKRLAWVGRHGREGIAAWDNALQRLTLFARNAPTSTVRVRSGEAGAAFSPLLGLLRDGSFVLQRSWGGGLAFMGAITSDSIRLLHFGINGEYEGIIASVPWRERYVQRVSSGFVSAQDVLFGRRAVVGAAGHLVLVGDSHCNTITGYAPSGEVVLTVQIRAEPPATAAVQVERRRQQLLDDIDGFLGANVARRHIPGFERALRHSIAELPHSEAAPIYTSIVSDHDGRVWIGMEGPEAAALGRDAEWWVLSAPEPNAQFRVIGRVSTPRGSRLLDASKDLVLILRRNELDVESVEIRRIANRTNRAATSQYFGAASWLRTSR